MIRNFLALIAALLIGAAPVAAQTISGPTQPVFPLLAPDGSAAAPSYSFGSDPDTGIYNGGANDMRFSVGNSPLLRLLFSNSSVRMPNTALFGWGSGSVSTAIDTQIARAAAGSFTFSNASTNSFTITAGASGSATLGGALVLGGSLTLPSGNQLTWGAGPRLVNTSADTLKILNNGSTNSVTLTVGAAGLATFGGPIAATGNIVASGGFIYPGGFTRAFVGAPSADVIRLYNNSATNTVDLTLGASNLLTVNGAFTATTNLTAGSGNLIGFSGRSLIASPANGNIRFTNAAGTDFGLAQFGGTTSPFPALKRSGAALQVRLADDSGDAALTASTVQTVTGYSAAGTALPTCNAGAAGTRAYVTDATAPTFLGAYVSGGAVVSPVFCTGAGGWVTGANDNFVPMEMAG